MTVAHSGGGCDCNPRPTVSVQMLPGIVEGGDDPATSYKGIGDCRVYWANAYIHRNGIPETYNTPTIIPVDSLSAVEALGVVQYVEAERPQSACQMAFSLRARREQRAHQMSGHGHPAQSARR
jgi:hypothetical protein